MSVIAERVKSLAQSRGISVRKLLIDVNLNTGFVTDLDRKQASPSADKLVLIADYLDCSIDYLLGRTDNPEVNK